MTRMSSAVGARAAAITALALVAALALPPAASAAGPGAVLETPASAFSTTRPAETGWFVDTGSSAASFGVTKDGPGHDAAMRLDLGTTSDKVYLYRTFAPGERPRDIPASLVGASYDYAGTNVNFQVEVIFEPADVAAYGPAGTTRACTPASTWYGWGLTDDTDWCYTVLKWEPYVAPGTSAWTHVDLSVDTAAHSATSTGGWVSSKNLGAYVGNVSTGQLLSTYLGEIADYEVTAYAFGAGSGTPGPVAGYLEQFTIGGTTHRFVPEAEAPAPPPAASTDELEDLIVDRTVDVAADTERFVTTGTSNADLESVDAALALDGVFENWTDPTDAFVDVFTYSDATFIGTFPVVSGDVVLTGADLSHLEPGVHHFLFRGQASGTVAVVRFTVVGLAATGMDAGDAALLAAVSASAILGGVVALVLAGSGIGRRRRHRRG